MTDDSATLLGADEGDLDEMSLFELQRTMVTRTYNGPMTSDFGDKNGTVTTGVGLIYATGVTRANGEPWSDVQAAGGAYEWAENLEHFNQDPFGYLSAGLDIDSRFGKDSYFYFKNYWSILMKPYAVTHSSVGSYMGLAVGQAIGGQGALPLYTQVHLALRYSLGESAWQAVVSNKWASAGNRTKVVTVTPSLATFDLESSWRLEILYDPRNAFIDFWINQEKVLRFTDEEHGEGDAPLQGIIDGAFTASSTLLGGGPFVSTGSDALGEHRAIFCNYTNTTWVVL